MILLVTTILVGCLVAFWSWTRSFFQDKVIPAVRSQFGDTWAEYIVDVVMFLDSPISAVRDKLAKIYRAFKTHVLGIRQKLTLVKPGVYNEIIEADVFNPQTKTVECVTRGPVRVNLFELPEPLRQALQDQKVKEGVLSWGEAMDQHLRQKAKEENIELVLQQANA